MTHKIFRGIAAIGFMFFVYAAGSAVATKNEFDLLVNIGGMVIMIGMVVIFEKF